MLFTHTKYTATNGIDHLLPFVWTYKHKKIEILFSITAHKASALPRCPYAGFAFSEGFSKFELTQMTKHLIAFANENCIHHIAIKQRPNFCSPVDADLLHTVLLDHGFRSTQAINHHIDLRQLPTGRLHPMQQRRIRKCVAAGFTFQKEHPSNDFYTFIAKCRQQQSLQISINLALFLSLTHRLPSQYQCFSIRNQQGRLVACTLLIEVSTKVIYNFLPAFDREWSSYSPLSFLQDQLYDYFHKLGYHYFDLGISSIDGIPQESLIIFKERMGGIYSPRYSYTLTLSS